MQYHKNDATKYNNNNNIIIINNNNINSFQ